MSSALIRILLAHFNLSDSARLTSTCRQHRASDVGVWGCYNKVKRSPDAVTVNKMITDDNQSQVASVIFQLDDFELGQLMRCTWSFPVMAMANIRTFDETYRDRYIYMHALACNGCRLCRLQDPTYMNIINEDKRILIGGKSNHLISKRRDIIIMSRNEKLWKFVESLGYDLSVGRTSTESIYLDKYLYKSRRIIIDNRHAVNLLNFKEGDSADVLGRVPCIQFLYPAIGSTNTEWWNRVAKWIAINKPKISDISRWYFSSPRQRCHLGTSIMQRLTGKKKVLVNVAYSPNISCIMHNIDCIENFKEISAYLDENRHTSQ